MRHFILLLPILLLAACQTTNTRGVSFIDPDYRGGKFNSLVIEGQADLQERQALEIAAADALNQNHVRPYEALRLIPPTKNLSEKQRQRKAAETGADGVLVIEVLKKDVVSSRSYAGGPYYGGGLYGGGGSRSGIYSGVGIGFPIGSPYEDYRELRAEEGTYRATLYTLPGLRVAWTGEFKTRGPYEMDYRTISRNVAQQVVARLQADGMI